MRSGFHFLHGQTKRRFRLGVLFVAAGFSLLHVTQHVFTNQGYTNDSNRNRLPDMDWYRSGRDGLVGHSFLSRAGYVLASFLYLHPGDFRSRTENGMRVWKTGRRTAVLKNAPATRLSQARLQIFPEYAQRRYTYSSVAAAARRRRFGFSSTALLSISTPANSGSIMIRPQYSHTIIFLRIRISN